jgi:hypothetical protein
MQKMPPKKNRIGHLVCQMKLIRFPEEPFVEGNYRTPSTV